MKITAKVLACLATVSWLGMCGLMPQTTLAQSATEPAGPSYNERWRVFKPGGGTKQVDPNVYVYTPEFAKRFQMPEEWISTELKGVDAVAFRVVPSYPTCGWGGDPKACNTNEVRCKMDLYFDHQRNPLPWDARMRVADTTFLGDSSAWFVGPLPYRQRASDGSPLPRSPFTDPKNGKELIFRGGYMGLGSYDREIFKGMAFISMGGGCGEPADALWLSPYDAYYRDMAPMITLPQSWRERVRQALRETNDRAEAFYKREGEKAMKALRESPVPQKSIVPVQ